MVLKRFNEKEVLSVALLAAGFTSICILLTTVSPVLDLKINDNIDGVSFFGVFISGIIFLILLAVGKSRTLKRQSKEPSTKDNTSLVQILYIVGIIAILATFLLNLVFIIASYLLLPLALSPGDTLQVIKTVFNSIFLLNQVIIFVVNICFSSIPVLLGEILIRPRLRKFLWAGLVSNIITHLVGAGIIIHKLLILQENIYGRLFIGQYFPLGLAFIGYALFFVIYYSERK